MTGPDLREHLDDLVTGVPSYVERDPRAAWAAGARRRTRHRLAVGGLAVALVLLAGVGAGVLPRVAPVSPADGGGGVTGHPARIDDPWWTRDLPYRPGPVAGVLARVSHDGSADQDLGWYAVSATGGLWRLPGSNGDFTPAISPDGTRLAYLDDRRGHGFEIRDLVGGTTTEFDIGSSPASLQPWALDTQSPSFWSPDSARVLVPVYAIGANAKTGVRALVLGEGGTVAVGAPPTRGAVMPIGWASSTSLDWLTWREAGGVVNSARVVTTSMRGRVQRAVSLDVSRSPGQLSQWAGVVSRDGRSLALGATAQQRPGAIRIYDLGTGNLRASAPGVPDAAGRCLPSWGEDTLQVPTEQSSDDELLRPVNGPATILGDPRLGAGCSLWATDALDGPGHGGLGGVLFGQSTSWLAWHWREVALGGLGLALLVGLVGLVVRRRRRPVSG